MHIQVTEEMNTALAASKHGYIMKQRGEVEIKVREQISGLFHVPTQHGSNSLDNTIRTMLKLNILLTSYYLVVAL